MKKNKTMQELRDTRVKTTFEVKIEVELPYLDNANYLNVYLSDMLEEITNKVFSNNTEDHIVIVNDEKEHKMEAFFGIEEEQEYNIHDWDI